MLKYGKVRMAKDAIDGMCQRREMRETGVSACDD